MMALLSHNKAGAPVSIWGRVGLGQVFHELNVSIGTKGSR